MKGDAESWNLGILESWRSKVAPRRREWRVDVVVATVGNTPIGRGISRGN